MASLRKFEDIEAWQKARELARAIYAVTKDGSFGRDFGLRDQIRRAAVSIMSNIAEGFGRGGNKEFTQFLSIAKGSVAEVQSQLFVAQDAGYLNSTQFQALYEKAETTARLIGGLIRYLQKNDFKGSKYK
jgi:four helix bundle protein